MRCQGQRSRTILRPIQVVTTVLSIILSILFVPFGVETAPRSGSCTWEPLTKSLICSNLRANNSTKGPGDNVIGPFLRNLGNQIVSEVQRIQINGSFIPALNLKQFEPFRALEELEIHNSNVCGVWGTIPGSWKTLNLSHNVLMSNDFGPQVFNKYSKLEVLDFSYNKLDQLPNNTLQLNLKQLFLMGNELKCNWITRSEFYDWASKNHGVLQNIDDTFCLPDKVVFTKMSILSAIKVRQVGLDECQKLKCECDIYTTKVVENGEITPFDDNFPAIHSNKYGKVYLTLELDCSNMELTDLPPISPFAVALNVDRNKIRDLSRLNSDPNYAHLTSITLNHNLVENLEPITSTKFFDRVHIFEIRNNSLSRITDATINGIFSSSQSTRTINKISIGDNTIHCNCTSFERLRPTLIAHESIVRDWKTLRCRLPNVTLHDLRYDQACRIEGAFVAWPWHIVIGVECFLIGIILLKVWIDRRYYRRTRQLPSLSRCMPSLPCDFMLERIEDSKIHQSHSNRNLRKPSIQS